MKIADHIKDNVELREWVRKKMETRDSLFEELDRSLFDRVGMDYDKGLLQRLQICCITLRELEKAKYGVCEKCGLPRNRKHRYCEH